MEKKNIDFYIGKELNINDNEINPIIVNHYITVSNIKKIFCFNAYGNDININNIKNNKIKLFTFIDNLTKSNLLVNISKLKVNNKNLVDDYLELLDNTYDKKTIKSKINQYFYDKMENDLKYIQKNSKLYYTNNNLKNLECSNLLTNIINLAPKRFSKMNKNKINSLPFIKNDTIYFYILLNYNNIIKKFYKIIITLV
jgi:hypothetical protein